MKTRAPTENRVRKVGRYLTTLSVPVARNSNLKTNLPVSPSSSDSDLRRMYMLATHILKTRRATNYLDWRQAPNTQVTSICTIALGNSVLLSARCGRFIRPF